MDSSAIRVHPVTKLEGTVSLPGSKSITNRALVISSLARGRSVLSNALDCEDSCYLVNALTELGVKIEWRKEDAVIEVEGAGGAYPVRRGSFYTGNAGTATRFLTAVLAAGGGSYTVEGDARMRERPIAELVRALKTLGADVEAPSGCPPVTIGGGGGAGPSRGAGLVGGRVDIPGSTSSQFTSAILMAAPLAKKRVEVRVTGELVSAPYIELTLHTMEAFGVKAYADYKRADGQPVFGFDPRDGYAGCEYFIEGDASSASYFYAAAAVTGSTLRVEGVGKESPQGDARCADVLAAMGCRVNKDKEAIIVTGPRPPRGWLKGVDWNCADIPDVVPTLAVVALFAHGKTRLRGVAHLRHKESDRIQSTATELRKLGAEVVELRDGLEIHGSLGPEPTSLRGATIDTWGDHRIAMAFSVASLVLPDMVIKRPQVVEKSFPGFFETLDRIGVRVEKVGDPGA